VRVTELFSYPIKGCYRNEHVELRVEPQGFVGDRRFMVTTAEGKMLTQREVTALVRIKPRYDDEKLILTANGHEDLTVVGSAGALIDTNVFQTPIQASLVSAAADEWVSAVLGQRARLVFLDDPARRPVGRPASRPEDRVSFADAYPILLANAASLDMLNDWLLEAVSSDSPLPMTRFRPNIVISGASAWAEDDFVGRKLTIGEVTLRAPEMCGRCVVTTTDQDTGERGREPLRTLARHRTIDQSAMFGLALVPEGLGVIRVGDEVTLG
jgi:uncharacterized protein